MQNLLRTKQNNNTQNKVFFQPAREKLKENTSLWEVEIYYLFWKAIIFSLADGNIKSLN